MFSPQAPFLPDQTFMQQNRESVSYVFDMLTEDFPDRAVTVEGEELSTKDALQLDDGPTLSPAAREWLATHAVGKQHGYDRPDDEAAKIFIKPADKARYMGALSAIRFCGHSLVNGGYAPIPVANSNLLIGGGFPHLAPGRLRHAIEGEYDNLWEINTLAIISGQRRRWNDNENEDTTNTVIRRMAHFTGFDVDTSEGRAEVGSWLETSKFAYGQENLRHREGTAWEQPYATEAEMARGALELALWRVPGLFNWKQYPVTVYEDPDPRPIDFEGFHVPSRTVRAWEYQLNNGRSAYVTNGVAVARDRGGEPRATSISAMEEATTVLGHQLRSRETIVAFGAPHVRAAVSTAGQIIRMTMGQARPTYIANSKWEFHEPPVTGIASIAGSDLVDGQIRSILRDVAA